MYSNDDMLTAYNDGVTSITDKILKVFPDSILLAELYKRGVLTPPKKEKQKEGPPPDIDIDIPPLDVDIKQQFQCKKLKTNLN